MFVSYSRKGDKTYARMVTSRRVGGVVVKETSNLGRVVDRERHVLFWFNKNCAEIALIFEQRTHRFLRSIRIA